ncbi:MAG: M20 family metallopeptidase, partial [Butyricicoccus sp.]|nr:M20 family metallopeptidase [Butyricicoccus sp.]
CAALRADMDALPVCERTGAGFASESEGWMHACGHDFHVSAALGAARLLSEARENLRGTVKFLFQPDEEGDGGARPMIDAGCLESPNVDAVFGAHVDPNLPAGSVGVRYGKFYAASNPFRAVIHGKSSHGAEPEKGVDALYAAACVVRGARELSKTLNVKNGKTVISICTLHAGAAENIIAGEAELRGMIRTLGPEARQEAVESLRKLVVSAAESAGASAEVEIRWGYPGVVNHDECSRLAESAARRLLGDARVIVIDAPTMTTEDFGYFLEKRPGCFYHFGVGGDAALHSDRFLPDDRLLPDAAAVHAAVISDFLNQN